MRLKGISERRAKRNSRRAYFFRFLVWEYPSTSIKAKPLEIFIVLLIVGHLGGPLAMIVAIPCYTVVRVIAFRFFRHIKAIRRLIPSEKLITDDKNEN